MNSHICHGSPSFRVSIDWRRKEIIKPTARIKKIKDTHSGSKSTMPESTRNRHSWILGVAIHVRSETGKKKRTKWRWISSPASRLEWDSLVKLFIHRNQSPRNWHRRPSNFGTNPRGWSIRWCYGDNTISILCDVPLAKTNLIIWTLWIIGEMYFLTCMSLHFFT